MNPNNATPLVQPIQKNADGSTGVNSANPYNTTTGQLQITPVDGNTPKVQTTPINASIIGTTTPLTIPNTSPTVKQDTLSATAKTQAQPTNVTPIETNPSATTTSTNSRQPLLDQIKSLIGIENTKGDVTTQLQNEQDLAGKTQAVNDISNKILTTSRGYDEQIKNLQKNGTGYNGGNQVAIDDLNRQRNEDIANLSIIKSTTLGDLDTANTIIKQKLDAQFEPLEANIKNYEDLYNLTANDLTDSEKLQIQTQIDEKKQSAQNLYNAKQDALKTASANGAPASVLAAITAAPTPEASMQALGQYGQNALDNQYKRAQIANIYSDIADRNAKNAPSNFVTPPIINPVTGKADPANQLASVIAGAKAKDNPALQAINGVVAATQQLAEGNANGKFPAISFGSIGGAIPILANGKGQDNLTAINAINLKVQQWASGASLTKQQTEQVEKITPKNGDTNAQIRNKTNSLTNFMLNQAKGVLTSQGIKYEPNAVDFFSPAGQLTENDINSMDKILGN